MSRHLTADEEKKRSLNEYLAYRDGKPENLTPSVSFGNASPGRPQYKGNSMGSARPDADQHFQFKSIPMGAQIKRV